MFKTWEQLSRKEQLESMVWDAYKDAYGFRPRHMNIVAMTFEAELEAELEFLEEEIARVVEREQAEQALAVARFEQRVQSTIAAGAKDRETAIRWIRVAEGAEYGDEDFLCYCLGLPYGYFKDEQAVYFGA